MIFLLIACASNAPADAGADADADAQTDSGTALDASPDSGSDSGTISDSGSGADSGSDSDAGSDSCPLFPSEPCGEGVSCPLGYLLCGHDCYPGDCCNDACGLRCPAPDCTAGLCNGAEPRSCGEGVYIECPAGKQFCLDDGVCYDRDCCPDACASECHVTECP